MTRRRMDASPRRRPGTNLKLLQEGFPAFKLYPRQPGGAQASKSSATPGCRRRRTPLPVADLRHVLTITVDVVLVIHQPVTKELLGVGGTSCKTRDPIDHITDEMKTIDFIEHHHVEGRGRRSFLLVAAHMQAVVIGASIGQAMDEPGIAVKREDDRLVAGE